ncbi:hypothetical protein PGT21_005780 [Puccinia graminis f. sp. tritici]|uniref:Uncharacterized protein n=1 Tax=Puccinia graminis f. sp. tritici TaxID=56615 RepID=A0A5B0M2R6_PUCGR|nr:hypothetical protein PGT21_005780 [Puccinia graminis f. sp. tritici]KAA1090140.1 hypothetical protein PGTUg99_036379 [Puccinia graminis f. sp. tritici]
MDTKEITHPEQELATGKKDYDKLSLGDANFGADEANVFPPAQCSTAPQVNTLESFEHSDFMRDSNSLKETIGDSKGGLSSTLPPQAIQYLFEQLIKSPSGIPGNVNNFSTFLKNYENFIHEDPSQVTNWYTCIKKYLQLKYYENPGYFGPRLDYSLKQFQDD